MEFNNSVIEEEEKQNEEENVVQPKKEIPIVPIMPPLEVLDVEPDINLTG